MWEMILEYIWLIFGFIYHYLVFFLPFALGFTAITLFGLPGFFIGRWYERIQWRREIKSGKRLGELVQIQLKKRDDLIKRQAAAIEIREEQAEFMEIQQKRFVGIAHEMDEAAMAINYEALKRRRRV